MDSGNFKSTAAVEAFTAQVDIAPAIVVGRLQHEGRIRHSHLNGLRCRLGANITISCCGVTADLVIASVKQSGNMQVQQEAARACPKCGSEMVLRAAKENPHLGKRFRDCSEFPGCRGVVSVEG